ncbi:hypothetical protein NFI96_001942 [Prochilodus magdalenae]|nr:hypothetical protein NFI96_001942 [Prochilodus magdalenae]
MHFYGYQHWPPVRAVSELVCHMLYSILSKLEYSHPVPADFVVGVGGRRDTRPSRHVMRDNKLFILVLTMEPPYTDLWVVPPRQKFSEWKWVFLIEASGWKYKVGVSNKVARKWKYKVGVSNKVARKWKYKVGVSNKVASNYKDKHSLKSTVEIPGDTQLL